MYAGIIVTGKIQNIIKEVLVFSSPPRHTKRNYNAPAAHWLRFFLLNYFYEHVVNAIKPYQKKLWLKAT